MPRFCSTLQALALARETGQMKGGMNAEAPAGEYKLGGRGSP